MKKMLLLSGIIFILFVMAGCDQREKLYILNWGDYINDELVAAFEKEFGVRVVPDNVVSNESMYSKIQTRAGKYDVVFPSDYMIEKMRGDGLLLKLDYGKLPNYDAEKIDSTLQNLRDEHFPEQYEYSVPYFWGTLAIMYNEAKPGVKELVEEHEWAVFFDKSLIPADVTVGMYDSSRDAVAAALFYLGRDPNPTSLQELDEVENLLINFKYDFWGTDNLKDVISSKNLDIALVYSGDYFDTVFYTIAELGKTPTFNMHVPTAINNVWYDTMAIPVTSTNVDLAHEFINFFLSYENSYENAAYVGYCPVRHDVYEAILDNEEIAEIVHHSGYYPGVVAQKYVYTPIEKTIAARMDQILTNARNK